MNNSSTRSSAMLFIVLLSLIVAISIQSLLYAALVFNGIYLHDNIYHRFLLLILFIILFTAFKNAVKSKIKPIDYITAILILIPVIILRIFSQIPLVDDLRYIGSALLYPNSFYSLIGYSAIVASIVLGINVVSAYWILVFLSIYTLILAIVNILRRHFSLESNIKLAISVFMIIYTPSAISLFLFPKLLIEPYEINKLIFDVYEFHYLGRNVNLDPNLLKNIAVLLSFVPLLLKNIDEFRSIFLVSLLWVIAYLYHPLDALTSIIIVVMYVSTLFVKHYDYKLIKLITKLALLTALLYSLAPMIFGYSVFLLGVWNENKVILTCINAILILLIIIISSLAVTLIHRICRSRIIIVIIVISISLITMFKLPIELQLSRHINLRAILLYGYYMTLLAVYVVYRYNKFYNKVSESRLSMALLVPTIVIVLDVLAIKAVTVILRGLGYPAIDTYRYLQVLSRVATTPAFGLSLVLFSIPTIVGFVRRTSKSSFKALVYIMILFSTIQTIFFILYWGFYYRNPWASGVYNATVINEVLLSIDNIDLKLTPYVHTIASQPSIYLRDILGLKIGFILHTPTSINDPRIPWDLKNIVYIMPDIIISDNKHDILSDILKPKYTLNVGNHKVYIYELLPPNENSGRLALVGPIPSPLFAPGYYRELVALQRYYYPYRLVVIPDEDVANRIKANIVGKFKPIDPLDLTDSVVDLKRLWSLGYKYLYVKPKEKTICLKIEIVDRKSQVSLHVGVYPSYISERGSFLLSIRKLVKMVGWSRITIYDSVQVMAIKDYRVDIQVYRSMPGTALVLHVYDFYFAGNNSFIDISNGPLISNRDAFSLVVKNYPVILGNRKEHIIYTEGDQGGTLFHLSYTRHSRVVFAIKLQKWYGCGVNYVTNTTLGVSVVRNGHLVDLYIDGMHGCRLNVSEVLDENKVIYSHIGGSWPIQDVWFNGRVSYIALYNSSISPYNIVLARFDLLPGKSILLFLDPQYSVVSGNYSLLNFHGVSYVKAYSPSMIVLDGVFSDKYIHLILPDDYQLIVCINATDIRIVSAIKHSRSIEYVIEVNSQLFSIFLDQNYKRVYIGHLNGIKS